MSEPILSVRDLKVTLGTYLGRVKVVRGLSFDLAQGETLVMVGESGCGKTMTARSLMGLLPERISKVDPESKVIFGGENLLALSEKRMQKIRGRQIAMIFQDPSAGMNPTATVGNQLKESILLHRRPERKELNAEIIRLLEMVQVPDPEARLKQYSHELSGGMKQRILIAMALAPGPKILIADEPTTALDVTIQAEIVELLKRLQRELKMSVILITHDLGLAAEIGERIGIMYGGELVEIGIKEEIFCSPKHPYTIGLLKSVPAFDAEEGGESFPREGLFSLEGQPPDLTRALPGCVFLDRCDSAMKVCVNTKPQEFLIKEGHRVKCWLNHEFAGDFHD